MSLSGTVAEPMLLSARGERAMPWGCLGQSFDGSRTCGTWSSVRLLRMLSVKAV